MARRSLSVASELSVILSAWRYSDMVSWHCRHCSRLFSKESHDALLDRIKTQQHSGIVITLLACKDNTKSLLYSDAKAQGGCYLKAILASSVTYSALQVEAERQCLSSFFSWLKVKDV